ncbi:hypothetical protein Fmac_004426 [Flemingia macrophylla]|uniref:non-specific serine/threonine protein kinase n=1 Tax=Flemingia macrophylla TaxID=520843 RepID=A0ABD1N5I8_9FABA
MDPFVTDFQLNPVPMKMPSIIIPSANDSKILLQYYNSSLEIDGNSNKIVKLGAVASIGGGLEANYNNEAPKVVYYSARGPDPEDSFPHEADIMKPNLVAPGNFIWAAWSSVATDSAEFLGENFAMMSGTSMAAPHVAGLAALIKQKFPNFSPASIGSALSTSASLYDNNGRPIMAQRSYPSIDLNQSPATPFDMGSGFVNATAALNPGLVFDSSYDDYMSFLCGINGSTPTVLNYAGQNCWSYNSTVYGPDLNLPSITIARLNQSRVVQRTIQNIAGNETFNVGWSSPYGTSMKVSPSHFSLSNGQKQVLSVIFNATSNSSVASFGRIGLYGNQDTKALISVKSQLSNDTLNTLSSWNNSSSPCNWTGVLCDRLGQRVTGLDLSGLGLSGHLSPYIGNLSFLQSLQLQNNRLTGVIPDQLGNLFSLRVLNMSSNMFEGKLPSNISHLNNLQILDLSSNRLFSKIPDDIDTLKKLEVLKLGRNSLYGAIPASLGNISSLKNISFGTNSLTGWIPGDLGRLHGLIELDLTLNNLTGTVPPVIYNLSSLVNLALAANSLWGEIPQDVGQKLPKLLVFNFCFNKFTGRIPGSLHNLTNIRVIRMASNHLEGTVPPGLGNLPFLRMYNIGYNRIVSSGVRGLDFITSLTNSTHLNFLAIDGNLLEGVIPESIGNLSKDLSILFMGGNRFNGSIPSSIAHLSGLKLLNLSYNSIYGEIPQELSQLEKLQELSLAGNEISGGIPNSLGNLLNLNQIDLSRNKLVGTIPASFGKLQNLLYMDLSSNKLNGSIPMEILNLPTLSKVLNLSMNFLSGPIPQVGKLIRVSTIDFSRNQLYADIPSSFSNCLSLEKLILARNQLSGPIPKALGDVKGLETLDLSSNQLSGTIPIELQNLHVLKLLNLSSNDLEGAIPSGGIFQNLSAVHLEGNRKLCLHFPCMPHGHGRNARLYITIAIVVTLILCFTIGILLYIKNKRVKVTAAAAISEELKPHAPMVSYGELRLATEEFSHENLLGVGSFGSVYKGTLSDGATVAVKVLDILKTGSLKSFLAECDTMKNSRHRNLVKLITSCSSVDFKNNDFLALVYEYLCNGSLEDWIKGRRKHANGNGLNLMERLNIAIDAACALDYLHNDSEIPVVHCDLKPSNILLDENMTAKVGDFGLARFMIQRSTNQVSISSTHVLKGSIGYIPPEYGWGEKPSKAGDVYSFGIVLLELFTGKSPTNECFKGGLSIRQWVQSGLKDKTVQVIDPQLVSLTFYDGPSNKEPDVQIYCVDAIVGVGISCTEDRPNERIGIRDVVRQLKAARDSLLKQCAETPTRDTKRYFHVSGK